jgi:hypothetical protein
MYEEGEFHYRAVPDCIEPGKTREFSLRISSGRLDKHPIIENGRDNTCPIKGIVVAIELS